MKTRAVRVTVALGCALPAIVGGQEPDLSKPKVPIVSVVGCASYAPDGNVWTLTKATDTTPAVAPFTSRKEIEEARGRALGTDRYRLIGTTDFLPADELPRQAKERQRDLVARKASPTGHLHDGHKVAVKGLLVTLADEKRLNLLSVQHLSDTCP